MARDLRTPEQGSTVVHYFAYGSNMDTRRMDERKVQFSAWRAGRLLQYRVAFNKVVRDDPRAGYANVEPDPDSEVEGILYDVDEQSLATLDGFEGVPNHYRRQWVQVQLADGQRIPAVTYVAVEGMVRDGLKPTRKYLNKLLAARGLLSRGYVERLRHVETCD